MINSYAKGYATTNFLSENDFYVNNVGCYKKLKVNLKTYRPNGRKDYHLIISKNGEIIVNGKSLSSGKGYVFFPYEKQNYEYVASQSGEFFWIHFSGVKVENLLKELNIRSGEFNAGENLYKIIEIFENMILGYSTNMQYVESYAKGLLISMLSLIASPMNLPSPFYKAIKILSDVDINAPIKEVALSVGMNESYFIRAFKKTVGVSPLAYRNEKRITVAKNLLHETDFSVNEIASLCGFNDAMYFSRLFKLKEGISPLAYRRKVKNLP